MQCGGILNKAFRRPEGAAAFDSSISLFNQYFNRLQVFFIVIGLGKKVFAELIFALPKDAAVPVLSGLLKTNS